MRKALRLNMALRGSVLLLLLGAVAMLVAACGSDPTPTPRPKPTATPVPGAPTPTPRAAWEVEWEEVQAAAKEEGEIVIAMGGSASRNFAPRFDAFEDETGIKVIAATGRGSQQVEKIRSEREAGIYSTDVWMTGTTSTGKMNAHEALKHNFTDHIILPDIADTKNWLEGKHWFANGLENTAMGFCASPSVQFAYNTDLVDPATLGDTYWNMVDGRFKGKIVGILPWEPGQRMSEHYINVPSLGEPFIREVILNQDTEWVADGQQAVDLLANGIYSIFWPTGNASDDIDDLAAEGLPVANHFGGGFKEGGVIAFGGSCSAALLKDSPHPNAQKVFVNWWYGATNLYRVGGITQDQTLRTDVAIDNIDPKYVRDPNAKYLFPETNPDLAGGTPGLDFNRKIAEEAGLR